MGAEREAPAKVAAAMDTEQVVASLQVAACIVVDCADLVHLDQPYCQGELAELASMAAELLHAFLSWMPKPDEDDGQLLAALNRWLP
jgi:hypothetical protein